MFQQPINQGPGDASFTTHSMEILLMLLVAFILAWLFWWLWNRAKYMRRIGDLEDQIAKLKTQVAGLEENLEECGKEKRRMKLDHDAIEVKYNKLQREYNTLLAKIEEDGGSLGDLSLKKDVDADTGLSGDSEMKMGIGGDMEIEDDMTGDVDTGTGGDSSMETSEDRDIIEGVGTTAGSTFGRELDYNAAFKPDNLQIVEGIGPKIESILKGSGVQTWSNLASSSESDLRSILEAQGPRYRIHDPQTWPKQASFANDGNWNDLVEYQKFLSGGRQDASSIGSGLSKVEKKAVKILGVTLYGPDDLKVVEGIGPKAEQLLKNNGIQNWSELAGANVSRLQEILDGAGTRFRLLQPETWPKQASLAVQGRWKELEEYQDYLQGGRDLAK